MLLAEANEDKTHAHTDTTAGDSDGPEIKCIALSEVA